MVGLTYGRLLTCALRLTAPVRTTSDNVSMRASFVNIVKRNDEVVNSGVEVRLDHTQHGSLSGLPSGMDICCIDRC
eukprot:360572-Chlamydomonas_euryale.AAC.5